MSHFIFLIRYYSRSTCTGAKFLKNQEGELLLESLMTYCREEDEETLELLYRTYKNKMFYTALKLLEDASETENIVHDTFLILAEHLEQIGDVRNKKTWNYIVTILKNRCFDWMRKQKHYQYADDKENFNIEEMLEKPENIFKNHLEAEVIAGEEQEILTKLIMNLKYPYKEVLYLQYYNELGSKEIGEILSMKPDNVRKIASRARKILKEKMIEMGYGR